MSYTLFSSEKRTAKREHTCIWCGQKILAGEKYTDERSVFDGNIQRHRWHSECNEAASEYCKTGEYEFTPWDNERLREALTYEARIHPEDFLAGDFRSTALAAKEKQP